MTLWGRGQQCGALDGLLVEVRAGRSRVLVIRGEAGVGKTALLGYAAQTAQDFWVARAEGIESEMELPYAALHQLCAPMLGRVGALPGPQRDALGVAFGLRSGGAPDRFLVGLAVLGLLSEAAAERPLLGLVDDAQWLDQASAQALAFAARRLDAESVALLFGTRDPAGTGALAGLPDLGLAGLADADARAVLASVLPGRIDARVRDRIIAESNGNPLALLELPRGITAADLAGGFGLPGANPVPGRIEGIFERRIAPLPAATRLLLLLAAAEPTGDPALLWGAAGILGVSAEDAAAPAEAGGLFSVGARVIFRHPLVRSAVYRAAPAGDRRRVHRALAEATDPGADPDRRAWHRAQGAAGPDAGIAAEMEQSASRAQARGGLAAAAAFLARSAALTPEPEQRAERELAAAGAMAQVGAVDAALRLLAAAEAGPLDEFQRARADLLRGQIAFASSRGSDAPPLLLNAARRIEPLDARLARQTYLEALSAALYAGRLATGGGLREAAKAVGLARRAPPPGAHDLVIDGLALLITEGYAAGVPKLKRALSAPAIERLSTEAGVHWLWLGVFAAEILWDDENWELLSIGHIRRARHDGALGVLPVALSQRALVHIFEGDFAAATSLIEEAQTISEATGSQRLLAVRVALAAFRGQQSQASELAEISAKDVERRGEGVGLTFLQWATAALDNGLGRYHNALAAAQQASEDPHELVFSMWAAAELIEAATRSGVPERAAAALERLSDSTRASGSDWALGIEARSRALLGEGQNAERLYREAIDRLGRTRLRVELARAHLLYGEWLRRQNRRVDAREQLRTAHQMLASMGAEGFAERAGRELHATGERVRGRTTGIPVQLTAREAQIARLARDGLPNSEIAAQLFMSPRTVEYHLHKVFTKLDISSRNQLHGVLANYTKE